MSDHRHYLVTHFVDLSKLLTDTIEYIPDSELEFLVREMATILEYTERHVDMEE